MFLCRKLLETCHGFMVLCRNPRGRHRGERRERKGSMETYQRKEIEPSYVMDNRLQSCITASGAIKNRYIYTHTLFLLSQRNVLSFSKQRETYCPARSGGVIWSGLIHGDYYPLLIDNPQCLLPCPWCCSAVLCLCPCLCGGIKTSPLLQVWCVLGRWSLGYLQPADQSFSDGQTVPLYTEKQIHS